MSRTIYESICNTKTLKQKLLAVLIDPDKIELTNVSQLAEKINQSPATHLFIGGSIVQNFIIDELILALKKKCNLPIVLFPGHPSQISAEADGILFLSLLSGRNPDYLIDHHINAVDLLKDTKLEIIPTAYILIDGGKETAVQRVSRTLPIASTAINLASKTAKAGEYLGQKLIYLEAGSGALNPVPLDMIKTVASQTSLPIIVGGGLRSQKAIKNAYAAGADLVVIGTAFENDINFFNQL